MKTQQSNLTDAELVAKLLMADQYFSGDKKIGFTETDITIAYYIGGGIYTEKDIHSIGAFWISQENAFDEVLIRNHYGEKISKSYPVTLEALYGDCPCKTWRMKAEALLIAANMTS